MHRSDSREQRAAEAEIREALAATLGTTLEAARLTLPGGARVDVDGVDPERTVFVEIFARHGRLKGGQHGKIARDALKLITATRERVGARRIIAFADAEAAACVTGRSWLAEALRTWDVHVHVVPVSRTQRTAIVAAQERQLMRNDDH